MDLDYQAEVDVVRSVVIVDGEVASAARRRNCDEVGMLDQIPAPVGEMDGEREKWLRMHRVPNLFYRSHRAGSTHLAPWRIASLSNRA